MKFTKIARASSSAMFIFLAAGSASLAAEPSQNGPTLLNNQQLDGVTAGSLMLNLASLGTAIGGSIATTTTNGAGVTGETSTIPGSGNVESGLVFGTSVAIAPGGTASTGVGTLATSTLPIVQGGSGGTVSVPGAQISMSVSYVSGGPTFIP